MKSLQLIIWKFFLLLFFQSFGQNVENKDSLSIAETSESKILFEELYQNEKKPLIVVKDLIFKYLDSLPSDEINTVLVLKGEEAIKKYGKDAKNGAIILTLKNENSPVFEKIRKTYQFENTSNRNQKELEISGEIIGLDGNPIPGVIVSNLNEKESYYSDFDGFYSLKAHKNDVLVFFKNGFETKKIIVNDESTIHVVLYPIDELKIGEISIKKPVIYLYPTEKTEVQFIVECKGKMLTSFPKYQEKWDITAYPDGKILDKKTQRFYNSLFWDAEQIFPKEHYDYKNGFVIPKNKLVAFLIEKLEFLGLNSAETNDFIQYWLPILEKNEFNFIHFYTNSEFELFSKNKLEPKPDTSIRVFMEFYGLPNKIEIPEQQLVPTSRKGFTLVEWGGADVSIPIQNIKN